MAQIENIVISAGRKVSENYNTREASYIVTIRPEEGDEPKQVLETWTKRLQFMVDEALGDRAQSRSFHGSKNGRHAPEQAKEVCST